MSRTYDIAVTLRDYVRELDFTTTEQSMRVLLPESVHIRKVDDWNSADRQGFQNEHLPGVFVVLPREVLIPIDAGGTERDLVVYPFTVHLVAKDGNDLNIGMETLTGWGELLTNRLRSDELLERVRGAVPTVYDVQTTSLRLVNEQDWENHGIWRSGVSLQINSWEPRL